MNDPGDFVLRDELLERVGDCQIRVDTDETIDELRRQDSPEAQ